MNLQETIYRRKSFRSYSKDVVEANILLDIDNFIKNAKPLYPEIKFSWEFIGVDDMKCVQAWRSPHYIAMFSENTDKARLNLGFIFQQAELYMQSIGIGTCWLGLGKLNDDVMKELSGDSGMGCIMMMAFGYPENEEYRSDLLEFNRKDMLEISDVEDIRLECARIAPSAVNSQPWYFTHEGDIVHVYGTSKYLLHKVLGRMNKFDLGIALAHIYEENKETFEFFNAENAADIKGRYYIGSIKI